MKLNLRIDESNPVHTCFTVFVNTANVGRLTLKTTEFGELGSWLFRGWKNEADQFTITSRRDVREKGTSDV